MEATELDAYNNWLAEHMEELVAQYAGRVVAIEDELEMQIASDRFTAQVAFSPQLEVGFNLLGRASIFSRFAVRFHESYGIFSFEAQRLHTWVNRPENRKTGAPLDHERNGMTHSFGDQLGSARASTPGARAAR